MTTGTRHFYAAHNTRADLIQGNRGFANTWEISRFATREDRDAFVAEMENKAGQAVTRKEAEDLYRGCFRCTGADVPAGGLFGDDGFGMSRFWNESMA